MTPHILGTVTGSQGQTVGSYHPKPWLTATSPATASKLTTLMLSVVNSPNGTGVAARIPGIQVAGKTGTAQTGLGYIRDMVRVLRPSPRPADRGGRACGGPTPGERLRRRYDRCSHR